VIDVTAEKFDAHDRKFDVVVDTVGGETLERSYGVVHRGGRLVTLQKPPLQERAGELGITATFFIVEAKREELVAVADLVDRGELQITIANTFPLSQGRAAFESGLTVNRPPGKTVLVVR
jgi:NADPH:quinone reductase-like Zn-dependent oxidoreductase